MFSSLDKSPDFGYSSVITSSDQSLDSSYEVLHQLEQPKLSSVFEQTSVAHNPENELNIPVPQSFLQTSANNSANGWYTPQQFVPSSTFPYFHNTQQQPPVQNFYTNGNFNFNGAPDNYVPNSCPSLVELLQDTPLTPAVMTAPQIHRIQGNLRYKVQTSVQNFRPNHNQLNVQKQNKAKRMRTTFTTDQLETLETLYAKQLYVSKQDRQTLTKNLGISDRAIKVWFQNRRMKGKRDLLENSECSSADSSAGDVLETIENQMQQCEVINDFVSIPTDLSDKLGELINQFVPKEFMDDRIEEINSSLETSSVSSTSPVNTNNTCGGNMTSDDEPMALEHNTFYKDVSTKIVERSEDNYYIINNSNHLKYEPISPAEGTPVEMPIWKPEEMKSLFDKHFC